MTVIVSLLQDNNSVTIVSHVYNYINDSVVIVWTVRITIAIFILISFAVILTGDARKQHGSWGSRVRQCDKILSLNSLLSSSLLIEPQRSLFCFNISFRPS